MPPDLDPRFTFDTFVVGPSNRLAAAAARRVAESPGEVYNPLFLYSGSGLGKTHLLGGIGRHAERIHSLAMTYESTAHLMELLSEAVGAGDRDALRTRLRDVQLLLLDDVQFVAGQRQAQEELLRVWDGLSARGAQVVLTSDRPPPEIDALDDRLLSRFSGGLIVDIGQPDFETRVAIARRKARDRGVELASDIYRALARVAFTNVRELQGGLNRLIAVQELEEREIRPEEVPQLLGSAAERDRDEFGEFLADISGTVSAVVDTAERRVADALARWEGEGYRTRRLDNALGTSLTVEQAERIVDRFERDIARLTAIAGEIRELDPEARELGSDALRDPDRVPEAESLLAQVRDRAAPPPAPPPGPGLDELSGDRSIAVRAARAVLQAPGHAYNPLFVQGPEPAARRLLVALGNSLAGRDLTVAFIDGQTFADELIDALERNRLDGWRARYRRAEALILDGLDQLAGLERGHDELFHLFEELYGAGRQLVFSAARPPQQLPVPPRLQSRLEAGLVVELGEGAAAGPAAPGAGPRDTAGSDAGSRDAAGPDAPSPGPSHWALDREKVLWEWPYDDDWVHPRPD